MKDFIRHIAPFLPALLLLVSLAGNVGAALLDVGPTVPEAIPSSPPQHGYPIWYRDLNRVPLELCLSSAPSPNVPGSTMCNLLPGVTFDPAQPMVFPTNFPDEVFWWAADAQVKNGTTRARLIMAVEGAWSTGQIVSGEQIAFARIRFMVDAPVAGTYRIIFPYGERTFVNVPAGVHAIFHTEDVGISVGRFDGALQGSIGPFLSWDSGIPINVNGELFVGDPNVEHTVTGSPVGTNFFRVEGPPGSNLDGLGNSFVQTNLFAITGKILAQPIPTPLLVDKATYSRTATGTQVSIFSTTQPVSNVTDPFAPFPASFALLGTLSSLQSSGVGVPTENMSTNSPPDGKFFSASPVFADPGTLPATVRVTNTADAPPSPVDAPLVDEVTVSQAVYVPAFNSLTIAAASSDKVALPALQAFMSGMSAPLGTLTNGQLVVSFPVTDNSVTPPNTFEIPPQAITVRSAIGGEVTVPVVVHDELDLLPPTGSIVINGGAAIANSATVSLTLSATDNSGTVAQMQFSKDGVNFFVFEPYATTRTATLTAGQGVNTIYVRFRDRAGNVSAIYSDSIIFDTTPPTGSILINAGAASSESPAVTLTLSATDANGVTEMQFSKDGTNFFAFEPYATTRAATLSAGLGVNTIYVRFKDGAGNVSPIFSDSITYLAPAPPTGSISINGGAAYANSAAASLTLSATDAVGVANMQFSRDGVSWLAWEPYATSRQVNLAYIPGDGTKTIFVRFRDSVGNVSQAYSDTIIFDTTAPAGTVAINAGAAVSRSAAGTAAISATDANGVASMQLSWDGITWSAWENFATTRQLNVGYLPGDGVKILRIRFRDVAGNVSAPISDSIIYDTTAPAGSILINGGAGTTTSTAAVLTLSATDANGIAEMQFSKDGGATWFAFEPYATTRNVTLTPAGPGVKTVSVRFKDVAGNVSQSYQASITLQ